jgi:hypothetical protein
MIQRRELRMRRLALAVSIAVLAVPLAAHAATAPKCPNLLVIQDRSGSMNQNISGGTKWEIAKAAVHTLTSQNGATFRFGLDMFPDPSDDGNFNGNCKGGTVQVNVDYGTGASIDGQMSSNGACNNCSTPTMETLQSLASPLYTPFTDASRKQFAILLTDGAPNCNDDANTGAGSIAGVADLKSKGVGVFVVGFGAGVDPCILNGMAIKGGYPIGTPTSACSNCDCSNFACQACAKMYYQADNAQQLTDALNKIIQVAGGELGGQKCDDSCFGQGCPSGKICKSVGGTPTCVDDPCAGKQCGAGQFCRIDNGTPTCVGSCPDICPTGQLCKDGGCVDDPCKGKVCNGTDVCAGGTCIPNGCGPNFSCTGPGQICVNGACIDDPCKGVQCPANTACITNDTGPGAQCVGSHNPNQPDGGSGDGGAGDGKGGTGCGCGGAAALPLAPIALLWRRRRRA